jgi:predicted N-formylglutamate amidohydrolase
MRRYFGAPLYHSGVTRLLVDLNRSVGHSELFSEFSRRLDPAERADLLARHYFPHRNEVESWIDGQVRRGRRVVHVGVHSFAPHVRGEVRRADLGLLYDPGRASEVELCRAWKGSIQALDPTIRVRRNYPFLGKANGLVTHLRRRFGADQYIGVELEINQALLTERGAERRLEGLVAESLRAALGDLPVAARGTSGRPDRSKRSSIRST